MREIVVVQVGHCGNAIGEKFWEVISYEHGVEPDGQWGGDNKLQLQRINVYYEEARKKRWVPRCACLDLDKECATLLQSGPYGKLISPENVIAEGEGTGNNWAKGYHTDGRQSIHACLDLIRKQCESTDCLQGFQLSHSLGGGTGSGLGSLVLQKLSEEYPDRIVNTYSVFPSIVTSDVVVEPYNCVLGLNCLIETASEIMCLDNESMNHICSKTLKLSYPTLKDVNHLVSSVMAGLTAGFRFPGQLNTDLRKLMVNMVPFPRMAFLAPSLVPLTSRGSKPYYKVAVPFLVQSMFDPSFSMCHIDPSRGKFLTAAAIFRGRMSTKQVEKQLLAVQDKNSSIFVEWIPNNIKAAVCDIPPRGTKMSATFVGNNTAISELFRRQVSRFRSMLKKKAFLHWYKSEGMEEKEFIDAETNVVELISQYLQYQEAKNKPSMESIGDPGQEGDLKEEEEEEVEDE